MAEKIEIDGKKPRTGKKMTKGTKYRLVATEGRMREFSATLLHTLNIGSQRIAIFSVPKKSL